MKRTYTFLLSLIICFSANAQVLTLPGLVSYFPVSSLPGNVFKDIANGYDGTFTSGTTFTGDRFGSVTGAALLGMTSIFGEYAVVNDGFSIAAINSLSGFSLSFWINPLWSVSTTGIDGMVQIASLLNNGASGYSLFLQGGTNKLILYNLNSTGGENFSVKSQDVLKAGEWQLITFAADPENKKLDLYLNEKLTATTTTSVSFSNPTNKALYFGRSGGMALAFYKYDDAQLYGRAITKSEVNRLFYNCLTTVTVPVIINNNKFICAPGSATFEFSGGTKYNIYSDSLTSISLSVVTTSGTGVTASFNASVTSVSSSIWITKVNNGCESEKVKAGVKISHEQPLFIVKDTTGFIESSKEVRNYKKITVINIGNTNIQNVNVNICKSTFDPDCITIGTCNCAGYSFDLLTSKYSEPRFPSSDNSIYINENVYSQGSKIIVLLKKFNLDSCQNTNYYDTLSFYSRGISTITGINKEFTNANKYLLITNPINEKIILVNSNINSEEFLISIEDIQLTNALGQLEQQFLPTINQSPKDQIIINSSNLLSGFYILHIRYKTGHIDTFKLIKK